MTKKLISISLIAVAAMISTAIPSAQGGRYYSYNTSWTMTCSGPVGVPINILGTLYLSSKAVLGNGPAGCSSVDGTNQTSSGSIHTYGSSALTTWTWTLPGCFNLQRKAISNKVGVGVFYNCYANPDGTGILISSGTVTVGKPVGSTLP